MRNIFRKKKHIFGVLLIIGVVVLGVLGISVWARSYTNTHAPGVVLAGVSLDGKDEETVRQQLHERIDEVTTKGLTFRYRNNVYTFDTVLVGAADRDFAYELFSYDEDEALARAFAYGHTGSWYRQFFERLFGLITTHEVEVPVEVFQEELTSILVDTFDEYTTPVYPARLAISWYGTKPSLEVVEESAGSIFPYDRIITQTLHDLQKIESPDITLSTVTKYPTLTKEQVESVVPEVADILKQEALTLFFEEKSVLLKPRVVAEWLTVELAAGHPKVMLDDAALAEYLESTFGDQERVAQDAKFEMENGRVATFQESRDGRAMYIPSLKREMVAYLQTGMAATSTPQGSPAIEVSMRTIKPTITTEDGNDLGIKEIIGIGRSNFAGSPANRRHNIAVGAAALNGLLIKPEEEFSLITVLGNIDAENGYKEELVIKGNKTIPEFGGGLCQIGTTTFRATLASGLPITQRRNHSYRVSYYEPAGTDATIYTPWPDYRFKNDTGAHVLIQTYIEGDELIFEFWGTKDGRVVSQTEPRVYNITAPPPTKYIETLDLPPGKEKCTESAHSGADAEFTYTVTYANDEQKEEVFKSHYRPWQAVCLIGVEELSKPEEDISESESATSTAEVLPTAGI